MLSSQLSQTPDLEAMLVAGENFRPRMRFANSHVFSLARDHRVGVIGVGVNCGCGCGFVSVSGCFSFSFPGVACSRRKLILFTECREDGVFPRYCRSK